MLQKKLLSLVVAICAVLSLGKVVLAVQPWDVRIMQQGTDGFTTFLRDLPIPAASSSAMLGMLGVNGSTALPSYFLPGSGLVVSLDNGVSSSTMAVGNVPMTSIAGLNSALSLKMNSPTGTSAQYIEGNGSLNTMPTALSNFTNDVGFITSTPSAPVTSVSGKTGVVTLVKADVGLSNVDNTSDLNKPISTLTQTALNAKFATPLGTNSQYVRGDGTLATLPSPGAGTVTSVNLSSTDFAISGGPITSSGSIVANLNASGVTADTYSSVTVNTKGITTAGFKRSFGTATFAQSTAATQLSAARDAYVQYSYNGTANITLLAGQSVQALLEYADNSGMSTNLVLISTDLVGNSGVLGLTQNQGLNVMGYIPAGKYRRVRFVTTGSGVVAPTTIVSSQEVLD